MTLLITIIALALVFDYINGFHDAANSIATIVSTKVLTPGQAVVWAALFNFVAFFIFKDHGVANTIAKTVKAGAITGHDMMLVILAGLLSAITWNLITWWFGIPSSSSHALIGGFGGSAIAFGGFAVINSDPVLKTISFILLAPVIGMLIAFIISIWFIHSFKKGWTPKILFALVMLLVIYFLKILQPTLPNLKHIFKVKLCE
jgi:PiT family inorganic phosphate transporter